MLLRLLRDDSGQDLIEYGLLAAIVTATGALVFTIISGKMGTAYASWITDACLAWEPCAPNQGLVQRRSLVRDAMNVSTTADIPVYVAIAVASVAGAFDLATRRIPNLLTLGAAICGLAFHMQASGLPGARHAVLGWLLGLALFLVPFAMRGLGGGDVKLMAALGAWMGPRDVFWVAMYTGVAGGVLALALALYTGYLGTALTNVRALLLHIRVAGLSPLPDLTLERSRAPRLCYAVPIAIGTVVAVCLR